MNLPQVPVIRIDHLTAADRRAFRIADNKLAQEGKWDLQALAIEVEALISLDDVPIELTGIDSAEIDVMILGVPASNADGHDPADELPNLPSRPTTVIGEIWILGDHKLLVEQIIAGRQPANVDARKLTLSGELPMRWNQQRAFAGFNTNR